MKIAIDARAHGSDFSGIARYAQVLLLGIDRVGPEERIAALVSDVSALPGRLGNSSTFEWIELPREPFGVYQQCKLPGLLKRLGVECLHSVDVHSPLAAACSRIVTVHDLIPLMCPEQQSGSAKTRWRTLWKMWLMRQVQSATRVVTISACSQQDIARELKMEREAITVISPAAEIPVETPTPEARLRERFSLRGPVILSVGRRAPHKNLIGLLRAFSCVKTLVPQPLQLLIVGTIDERYSEPEREVARLGLRSSVTFTGHVSDEDLAGFYRLASVFAFPSLYEGYGLPVLEAMQAGLPVVASDRTAVPEIVGDAGLLVDSADPWKLAHAMARVLQDSSLAADLSRRGMLRSQRITPEDQAMRYLRLYEGVLLGSTSPGEVRLRCQI